MNRKLNNFIFFKRLTFLSQSAFSPSSQHKMYVCAILSALCSDFTRLPPLKDFLFATPKILDYYGNKMQYFKHHATIKVTG